MNWPTVEEPNETLRVALVVGLSHSGTTMLDLTLGAHPNVVGVGEAFNFGRKFLRQVQGGLRKPCTCGVDVSECELWGPVLTSARRGSSTDDSIRLTYAELTRRFRQLWPNDVLLDSSKKIDSIGLLRELPNVDLRVLLVVRDVRGWVASSRDRHPRRKRRLPAASARTPLRRGRRSLASFRAKRPIVLARKWHRDNRRYLEHLQRLGVPYRVVSYERLCLGTDDMLTEVARFLGVEPMTTLSPAQTGSHVVNGNLVRLDPDRSGRLSYDTRWMTRLDAQLPYVALPRVRRFNDELVWGHWP